MEMGLCPTAPPTARAGYGVQSPHLSKLRGDLPVSHHGPVGDLTQNRPDSQTEGVPWGQRGGRHLRRFPGKIAVQPQLGLRQDGEAFRPVLRVQGRGKIGLPFKPQPGQTFSIAGQQDISQRRTVCIRILHLLYAILSFVSQYFLV